jgi:hypothetical protein
VNLWRGIRHRLHRKVTPKYAVDPILGHVSVGSVGYSTLTASSVATLVYCMEFYTLPDFNSAFRGGGCE